MNNTSVKSFVLGALVGGIAGGVLALLFAPKPGSELRRDLRRKSGELMVDMEDYLRDTQDKVKTLINEGRTKSTTVIQDAAHMAEGIYHDAEQILKSARARVRGEQSAPDTTT